MATETLKALSDVLKGLTAKERAELLAAAAAEQDEKRHPVVVAAENYRTAMDQLRGEVTNDQAMQLVQAIDALGTLQGALSTTQLTEILRALLVHIAS